MPALIVLVALMALAALGLLMWRWLESVERIKVAREKAGGEKLARDFVALSERVKKIESYMHGEDVSQKGTR